MSWLFSRALVEAFSAASCLAGEPSAQLSGNPIPQAYCAPDRMTKFSRLSRFGMTYAPLTESLGEELLMSYLEGFPVKTSVPQDTAPVSPAVDQDSGLKWQGLLGKYNHATRSWKIAQCSLLEDLEQCLEIWPQWGSMRDGECFQQPMLAQTILEKESGLWPTPRAQEPARTSEGYGRGLKELVEGKTQIKRWPTPDANCGSRGTQETWLPIRPSGQPAQYSINQAVRDSDSTITGGKLNPMWVEWLMGWPPDWTDLKPLETDKFQEWQQQHLNF